jgi:hypothetical protein
MDNIYCFPSQDGAACLRGQVSAHVCHLQGNTVNQYNLQRFK